LKMMKAGVLALGLFAFAVPAHAQMTWTDKGFFAADAGVQAGKKFNTSSSFELYEENATLDTAQKGKTSPFFDVRGGYKVWRNLAVGAGFSFTSSKADVAITASLPDPAETDKPRSVSFTHADASRSEAALHLSATWMVPMTDKVDVGVSAGPTIFFVKNDTVASLGVVELPPGPVAQADIKEDSETAIGFHLGADARYLLTKSLGVGVLVRYAYGKADLSTGKYTAGGFQIGGGVRYRF